MAARNLDTELKTIPGYSQGVRTNASVRTIKLGRPICPFSKIEMEKDEAGRWVPKQGPTDPDRQNCQKAGGAWWKDCEARGHDPYNSTIVWYVTEDKYDDETGELTGQRKFRRSRVIPNIAQVAVSTRLNSGKGARRAITMKGFKRLEDMGYAEVCQYRNCQKPVNPAAVSDKYGRYCSADELALIIADQQGILLHRPDARLNGAEEEDKVVQQREKQLMEVLALSKGSHNG